mgnify:CR=1 FL=1
MGKLKHFFRQWKDYVSKRRRARGLVVRLISRAELLANPQFIAWQRWRHATLQQRALVLRTFHAWAQNARDLKLMRRVISSALSRHAVSALRVAWDMWLTVAQQSRLAEVCPAMGTRSRKKRTFLRWRRRWELSRRLHKLNILVRCPPALACSLLPLHQRRVRRLAGSPCSLR